MNDLPSVVVLVGGIFGLGSGSWGIAVIVAFIASIILALIGRDTASRTLGSIFTLFGILFVVFEGLVIIAYLFVEYDLWAKLTQM